MRGLSAGEAVAELRALNARFIHNFVSNDVLGHDDLLHPEFVCLQSDGSVLDRATYLQGWATGFDPDSIPRWETRDEQITVVGDVGLVRSTNVFARVLDGTESERAIRYTDTYWHDGARWWCLQAQLTPVEPPHVPGVGSIVSVYLRGVLTLTA